MRMIERRLTRLEVQNAGGVADLIGRNFDELTDGERERWTQYRFGVDASTVAEVELSVKGTLDFICDKRPKEPTRAELVDITNEVERLVSEVLQ